jgi:hypothetical protein
VENIIIEMITDALDKTYFLHFNFPVVDEVNDKVGQNLKYHYKTDSYHIYDIKDCQNI